MTIDFNRIPTDANDEYVLSRITDNQIFYYYFGPFKLGEVYPSKFRKDRNPSTGFYVNKHGELIYNDLSTSEKLNCFAFVAKMFNLKYWDAVRKVAADFGLVYGKDAKVVTAQILKATEDFDRDRKNETMIQFKPGKWSEEHKKFWKLFEITGAELKRERVYPIEDLYVNKFYVSNPNKEIRFAYVENIEGKDKIKVYAPYSKKMKWLTNIPLNVPFGLNDLKFESDKVIITKSKKDLIILKKFFSDVIATQNESESALREDHTDLLTKRFKRKIILWDNDETGLNSAQKFVDKGFESFIIPLEEYQRHGIKDVSDYVKYYGLDALKDLFKNANLI